LCMTDRFLHLLFQNLLLHFLDIFLHVRNFLTKLFQIPGNFLALFKRAVHRLSYLHVNFLILSSSEPMLKFNLVISTMSLDFFAATLAVSVTFLVKSLMNSIICTSPLFPQVTYTLYNILFYKKANSFYKFF